jgi:hypothetical protein
MKSIGFSKKYTALIKEGEQMVAKNKIIERK